MIDEFHGDAGDDLLVGGASQTTLEGDGGDDALVLESSQLARLSGDDGADVLISTSASARYSITLSGGSGNDVIRNGPAPATIDAGPGSDRIDTAHGAATP